ncbi:mucin-5AC isoform X1 [Dermacentor silvarum]|uniref:mucin-5AC isoform X1 n=1 Tax=Dermacentor silvarum TaxID=543639 RepID=UPI002101D00A|nr:mucin-5AC isoform X1 [Dermacentor silvarum]
MKPVSLFVLAVCLLAVQAQDLASRTFGFVHRHPALLQGHHGYSMSAQAQGHHDHALPAHHGLHTGHVHQAHGHVHQGQVSNAHQHQVGHGHHHNHEPSTATHSASAPIASKVNTVPVLMCRVVNVPVNTMVPAEPSASHSGSSGIQHVGSHIATSISHVFGRVVNPVVALLQNASVWLNRTAQQDPNATSLQHSSDVPHTAVIKKKLAIMKKLGHQPMSTASVPADPAVLTDAPTTPSLETAVPSIVAEATTRSRPTTKLSTLAPVVVSTVGAPAPTLGVPAPRADTFPILASTDMPASVPADVSRSNVAVQVADTTAAASESTLTSTVTFTRATLSTRAPTVPTTTSTLGHLNLRANSFTVPSTDLPASIPQEVSSTTRLAVDTTTLVSQSTLPSAATLAERTARATLSTIDFTSTVATTAPTLGSLDPRADPFTALATSTDESTFGPVHREQASTATVTSPGTKAPTPLFVESNARTLPKSVPKQLGASTSPATVGAVSVRPARFTAAPTSVEITSAPPFAAAPTILGTEAPPTATTSEGITIASTTDSAVTLPVVALSATPEPASSQPGKSTVYARSVRPKTR